ncbi:putative sulfatase [Gordonia effusa NBRC 100432]|uniref:Putative sulfatase n=1 Tax=Gordonia effusa NBRC 100432 TaxID=1077974 RepID=H0QYJ1_9ACTN|nr:sulfatase [Gordonia effusa]GAB17892.1 putative sulfatase [Gordonia effusa NBRC 100432]
MSSPAGNNVVLVHWHDLGRHLELYGASGAVSPNLEALAAQGFLFANAHAASPLCSPSRGALLTGRYPHDNGIVGLAHHGFGYRDGVQTLPAILRDAGWRTSLIGMQHESTAPGTLGYDDVDVADSDCDYVVDRAVEWLDARAAERAAGQGRPFLLNAGFFEVHRPYPADRYPPGDPDSFDVPSYLPDTPEVRGDLASFHSSINVADAATGRLVDHIDATGFGENTWIVFFTDHGEAFPGAKSTLYARGTGISFIVRPPTSLRVAPGAYDGLFSGVDLVPTILDALGVDIPAQVQGLSHAAVLIGEVVNTPVREVVFTEKDYHDSYDPIRAVRTEHYSYIENFAPRAALELPLDIADSESGRALDDAHTRPRPAVELYALADDPDEQNNLADDPVYAQVRAELARRLDSWRTATGDIVASDEQGTARAEAFMASYRAKLAERADTIPRSPRGADRDYVDASVTTSAQ